MADDNRETIKTVTPSGAPVKERITTIEAARELYTRLTSGLDQEAERRAKLKGLVDGNPPYDPTRLRELGMGNRTNVNFMEARAILNQKASADYELFFEVPTLIEVSPRNPNHPDQLLKEHSQIIAEEFTKMLMDWPGFMIAMNKAGRERDLYGLGLCVWRDEFDWRPKAYNRGNFICDSKAELDLDELEVYALRDHMTAGDLLRCIEDEKAAVEAGWDVAKVRQVLIQVYTEGQQQQSDSDEFQTSTWESIQQKIRNNDWSAQVAEFVSVKIIHLCVREVDDFRVSHYIMTEMGSDTDDAFMFRKRGRFEKMAHTLWLLPFDNGDTYIRSCRGLASMIMPHCDLSNRYLSQVFDAGFMSGSLVLQPQSAVDLSSLQLVRMGAITILPPNLKAIQTSFAPNLSHMVQLRELSSSIMKNNTGVFRQHAETFAERQPEKTARQVVEEVAKEARVEKATVVYDYHNMEQLYREIFRRVTRRDYVRSSIRYLGQEDAKRFVKRCVDRGVPEKYVFDADLWNIYATRAIGMGSWGVKLDITNQLLNVKGMLDEVGQQNALRDWIAVRVGYRNVDRYRSLQDRDKIPSNENSIAVLENNDMMEGSQCIVGLNQVHAVHERVHGELLGQLVQQFVKAGAEGLDVNKTLAVLQVLLPHYYQTLQIMAQDPSREEVVSQGMQLVKASMKMMKQLEAAAQRLAEMQQKIAEAQGQKLAEAEDTLRSREAQLKAMEIQGKLANEAKKQESLNAMRATKTEEQMGIARERAEADIELQKQKQAAEIELQALKTRAKLDLDRLKAAVPNVPAATRGE